MNANDSIDAALERLRHAFDEAGEVHTKLDCIEQGLAELELRLWLTQCKDGAIFCIEVDRLRAHQLAEPSAEGMVLLQRAIAQLDDARNPSARNSLVQTTNQMRILRGKPAFVQATTLAQAEKILWREMQRRTNISRRMRRHSATVTDLVDAVRDAESFQRALPLLGREADALLKLFRFNPVSVLWGSLTGLCQLATEANKPIELSGLKDYCQAQHDSSEDAKSLTRAQPALQQISAQIESLQPSHPLPRLLQSNDAVPVEQDSEEEPTPFVAGHATEPTFKPSGEVPQISASTTALPSEVDSLSRAANNLSEQMREGLLTATPMLGTLEALAKRVLEAFAQRQTPSAQCTESIDHLCELVDLAASGVEVAESEYQSVASKLESMVSDSRALQRIDDALKELGDVRARLAKTQNKSLESNLKSNEIDQLLETVERIKASQETSEAQQDRRLFGYLLKRDELYYALQDEEGLDVVSHHLSEDLASHLRSLHRDLAELFPQSVELSPPRTGLAIDWNGKHLALACDQVQGPKWLELSAPFTQAHGFARLADGRSLCVLSAELLLSDCR